FSTQGAQRPQSDAEVDALGRPGRRIPQSRVMAARPAGLAGPTRHRRPNASSASLRGLCVLRVKRAVTTDVGNETDPVSKRGLDCTAVQHGVLLRGRTMTARGRYLVGGGCMAVGLLALWSVLS